jgi:hypothetical protein
VRQLKINDSIIFKKLLKCEFGRVTKTDECKYRMRTSAVIKMNQGSIFMTFATKNVCQAYWIQTVVTGYSLPYIFRYTLLTVQFVLYITGVPSIQYGYPYFGPLMYLQKICHGKITEYILNVVSTTRKNRNSHNSFVLKEFRGREFWSAVWWQQEKR